MEKIKNQSKIWQPSARLEYLQLRANILAQIRQFFAERNVLEVETPLLCSTTATDPHIASVTVNKNYFLQTSPEFCMKRLLAAGSGPIYQICKAFRDDEKGRLHNPEFTMLEWYRPGFDHHQLMNEMDELLQAVLKTSSAERYTYREIFEKYLQLNPHTSSASELKQCAEKNGIRASVLEEENPDSWLHVLLTHLIEPQLAKTVPVFIYDFPITQAALAKIRADDPPVAERFEVYYRGIELANGYHELADADEQRQRFLKDFQKRKQLGYNIVPLDEKLLAALANGFPDCAGVALGLDRLIMLAANANSIAEVVSFVSGSV